MPSMPEGTCLKSFYTWCLYYFYLRTAQCTLGHDLDLTAHKIQQLCGRLVFTRLQTLLQLKGLEKLE